jgi:hypothetical protein
MCVQNIKSDTQSLPNPLASNKRPLGGESVSSSSCYSKPDLQQAFRDLEVDAPDCIASAETVNSDSAYFDNKVVFAIRDWNSSPASQILHIEGPPETKNTSITSKVACSVAKVLSDLNLPTVYLCCGWASKSGENWMISTIYRLIKHLAEHLDVVEGEYLDFDYIRIQELDGTLKTWDGALSIFSSLLDYAPPSLYVIIDGIERLENMDGNEKYVSSLLRLLLDRVTREVLRNGNGNGKHLKVLLTTTGSISSLNQLDDKELRTVTLNRQNTKGRPGDSRLGRSQIVLKVETYAKEM